MQMQRLFAFCRLWVCAVLLAGCASSPPASTPDPISRLATLMENRLALAEPVARAKWSSGAPIEDLPREEQIIQTARTLAPMNQLDADWVAQFYRAQITAGKRLQTHLHQTWKAGETPPGDPVDLAKELRPKFDALNSQFLAALAQIQPWKNDPGTRSALSARLEEACRRHEWPPAVATAALDGWM